MVADKDLIALGLKQLHEQLKHLLIVFDDENGWAIFRVCWHDCEAS